jgi:hypothetical protein
MDPAHMRAKCTSSGSAIRATFRGWEVTASPWRAKSATIVNSRPYRANGPIRVMSWDSYQVRPSVPGGEWDAEEDQDAAVRPGQAEPWPRERLKGAAEGSCGIQENEMRRPLGFALPPPSPRNTVGKCAWVPPSPTRWRRSSTTLRLPGRARGKRRDRR